MTGFWLGVAFRCVPPRLGAQVDPDGFKVVWEPVTRPAGVEIVTYQVIVNQGDRELSMFLPPSATSATIPGEFLEPGTKTGGELLAREVLDGRVGADLHRQPGAGGHGQRQPDDHGVPLVQDEIAETRSVIPRPVGAASVSKSP